MAFLNGFEKEAGFFSGLAKAVKTPFALAGKGLEAAGQRRRLIAGQIRKGSAEATERFGAKQPSASLAAKRIEKAKDLAGTTPEHGPVTSTDEASIKQRAASDLKSRQQRMLKRTQGPSFASRHPIVTGVGAAYAANKLLSSGQQQQDSRPAVMYPQP